MDADTTWIEPQDPYAAFSDPVRLAPPWDYIELGAWRHLGTTSGSPPFIVLARPARAADQLWLRFEYRLPHNGVRSIREHKQVDCEGWRTQTISRVEFSGPNLQGAGTQFGPTYSWEFAAPDTVADVYLNWHCSPEAADRWWENSPPVQNNEPVPLPPGLTFTPPRSMKDEELLRRLGVPPPPLGFRLERQAPAPVE